MRSTNHTILALFALFTSMLFISCAKENPQPTDPNAVARQTAPPAAPGTGANAWVMPFDVNNTSNASQDDYDDLAWKSFIALNWPALSGQRGAPDTSKPIGAKATDGTFLPVVWETFKVPTEVFLAGAATPPGWNSPPPPPPSQCTQVPAGVQILQMASKASPAVLDDLAQAGFPLSRPARQTRGPVIDQNQQYVRYDVRFNQSEFVYVSNNQYYNADMQQKAVTAGTFSVPPKGPEPYVQALPDYAKQGAVELKASWRVLDKNKDILERYYRQESWIVDPDGKCSGPYTMGLVGLHILRLTPTTGATWYWATFEHIDNVDIEDKPAPTRPNGKPLTPSFNPTGPPPPPKFPSGYSYEPPPVQAGKPLPPNPKPVDVWRITEIPPEAQAKNNSYRAQLKDTVWRYYRLVGTMNPYVKNASPPKYYVPTTSPNVFVNTAYMANTTMETYLQANSCVVCHAYTGPLGDNIRKPKYQIFTFLLRHAKSPKPTATPSP